MCVRVCVCVCLRACARVCACLRAYVRACKHVRVRVCQHMRAHVQKMHGRQAKPNHLVKGTWPSGASAPQGTFAGVLSLVSANLPTRALKKMGVSGLLPSSRRRT